MGGTLKRTLMRFPLLQTHRVPEIEFFPPYTYLFEALNPQLATSVFGVTNPYITLNQAPSGLQGGSGLNIVNLFCSINQAGAFPQTTFGPGNIAAPPTPGTGGTGMTWTASTPQADGVITALNGLVLGTAPPYPLGQQFVSVSLNTDLVVVHYVDTTTDPLTEKTTPIAGQWFACVGLIIGWVYLPV